MDNSDLPENNAAGVWYFRKQSLSGTEDWGYKVDTTRPDGDQVFVIHEGQWVNTEYENLARFLNNTRVFSPGAVSEITADEAAAAHPSGSTSLPPGDPDHADTTKGTGDICDGGGLLTPR